MGLGRLFAALLFFFFLMPFAVHSNDVFIAPLAEVVSFGRYDIAYGGGLSLGYGDGGAVGLRFLYSVDSESFIFMEMLFFARVYIFGRQANSGPFAQFNAGPVLFAMHNPGISGYGSLSAGVLAGWRYQLPFADNWYVEPAARVGYPYYYGVGVSFGFMTGGKPLNFIRETGAGND